MSDFFKSNQPTSQAALRSMRQGVADNLQSTAELRQEVEMMRRVLMHLVFQQARGETAALHEDPIRSWLGMPTNVTAEEALDRLSRTQAKVLGTATCPGCGAQVQDKEGITDEVCPWCGMQLETQR